MKKFLLIALIALAMLVPACAPLADEFANTPTPIYTLVQPGVFPTDTPVPTSTEITTKIPTEVTTAIPTDVATLQPLATASPADTPTDEATITPIPYSNYGSAMVTAISVSWSIAFTSCASTTPVSFSGIITANNETDIQYKWLLSGPTSYAGPVKKTNISTAGTINVHSTTFKLGCGNYSIYLQVIYPNSLTVKKHFTIP